MQRFWQSLTHAKVQMSALAQILANLDVAIRNADRVYK